MGTAGARTAAIVVAIALGAFVTRGCEPLTTAGLSPTDDQRGSNPSTHRKPAKKSQIPEFKSLLEHGNQLRLSAGPAIMKRGSSGHEVRDLQARLKQIGWFQGRVSGTSGSLTTKSVKGFQAKRKIPATGEVDQRTLDRLRAATRSPSTTEELDPSIQKRAGLDRRCMTGRAICISKRTRKLVWVVDSTPKLRMDVRFGSMEAPTREGSFMVTRKSRHQVSSLYHTPMPYAMFFSGGQVHYSADFAARGYRGASYGCVNVRDRSGIQSLYEQAQLGDKVIVYS